MHSAFSKLALVAFAFSVMVGCASTPREPACSREIESKDKGREFTLPTKPLLSFFLYDSKVPDSRTKSYYGEFKGRSGKVLCVEAVPKGTVYALHIEGIDQPLYVDGNFSYRLFTEGDSIKRYTDAMNRLKEISQPVIWARGIRSLWLSPNAAVNSGIALSNLEPVWVIGFSLGEDTDQQRRVQMTVKLKDGRVAYSLFEDVAVSSTFHSQWFTSDPLGGLTATEREQVKLGVPKLGMPVKLVRLVLGVPDSINRTRSGGMEMEQYVYRSTTGQTRYYYFYNGVLQTIQD